MAAGHVKPKKAPVQHPGTRVVPTGGTSKKSVPAGKRPTLATDPPLKVKPGPRPTILGPGGKKPK